MSQTLLHHCVHLLQPSQRRLTANQLILLDLQFSLQHLLLHFLDVLCYPLLQEVFLLLHLLLIRLQILQSQFFQCLLLLKPVKGTPFLLSPVHLIFQLHCMLPFQLLQLVFYSLVLQLSRLKLLSELLLDLLDPVLVAVCLLLVLFDFSIAFTDQGFQLRKFELDHLHVSEAVVLVILERLLLELLQLVVQFLFVVFGFGLVNHNF